MSREDIQPSLGPQRGFSVFLVIGLLIMTTIVTTAVFKALNQVDRASAEAMRLQTADAAAEAGKAAAEAFMQYRGKEMVAMMQQFMEAQDSLGEGATIPSVEFPLASMTGSRDQGFQVALVGLNTDRTPYEVKIQSKGQGLDGSKKVITAVYYVKGVYKEDLSFISGTTSFGTVSAGVLQDAIWAGHDATLCGDLNIGTVGDPSSIYVGERAKFNHSSCPSAGSSMDIIGNVILGNTGTTHEIKNTLNVTGDFYTGGDLDVGGGASGTLNIDGNSQYEGTVRVDGGASTIKADGDVLINGGLGAGSGSLTLQAGGNVKVDGDLVDGYYGSITIQSQNPGVSSNIWDLDYNSGVGTGTFIIQPDGATTDIDEGSASGSVTLNRDGTPNTDTVLLADDINLDAIESQLNEDGDKDHPFYVKKDLEIEYSKTWAEWVAECSCGLDASEINGTALNDLVTNLPSSKKDELFLNGAPVIDANDAGISFTGGTLEHRVILRDNDNSGSNTSHKLPGTDGVGNPGGNLIFLTSGSYEDFKTDGDANLIVYADGSKFEMATTSSDTLHGTITAKEGTDLLVTGDGTIVFDQEVIDDGFKGSDGTGSIFSDNPADQFEGSTSSSTSDTTALEKNLRLLAPTLSIQFMGSFENQLSIVDQNEADSITAMDPKPFLGFNRTNITADSNIYSSWDEMVSALNIQPIYSYRGSAAYCTAPTSSDWDDSEFATGIDTMFTIRLTITCRADGITKTATSPLYVTIGSGVDKIVTISSDGGNGVSATSSSEGSSESGSSSSESGVSSSSEEELVCDTVSTQIHGVQAEHSAGSISAQPYIGGVGFGESFDYLTFFKPDLSSITGTVVSADFIVNFGEVKIVGTWDSDELVYLIAQDKVDSWNSSTSYSALARSSYEYADFMGETELTTSGYSTRTFYTDLEYGSTFVDWLNLHAGNLDNPGFFIGSEQGNYARRYEVNWGKVYICATSIDGVVDPVDDGKHTVTIRSIPENKITSSVEGEAADSYDVDPGTSVTFDFAEKFPGVYTIAGYLDEDGAFVDDLSATSITANSVTQDTVVNVVMKMNATDCDNSDTFSNSVEYYLGQHVKEGDKLYECLQYANCTDSLPSTAASDVWIEVEGDCSYKPIDCYTYVVNSSCSDDGTQGICDKTYYTEDGTSAFKCKSGTAGRYCVSGGPAANSWGQWEPVGSCTSLDDTEVEVSSSVEVSSGASSNPCDGAEDFNSVAAWNYLDPNGTYTDNVQVATCNSAAANCYSYGFANASYWKDIQSCTP